MKMRILLSRSGLFVVLGLVLLSQSMAWAQQRIAGLPAGVLAFADQIVHNGKVVSMDDTSKEPRVGTVVQAMAIRDGTIIALGTDTEVLPYGGVDTQYINLQGRTVIPGLINPHLHIHDGLRQRWGLPVLAPAVIRSADPEVVLKEVQGAIQTHIQQQEPGTWLEVVITDRSHQKMALGGQLQLPWLDQQAPEHPIWLSMGGSVINSAAIKSIEDFWETTMVDDSINKETGIMPYFTEITRTIPEDIWMEGQTEYLMEVLLKEMALQLSDGVTSYATHIMSPHWIDVYGEILRRDLMPMRFAWTSRSGTIFNPSASAFYRRLGALHGVGSDFFWNIGVTIGHMDDTGFWGSCFTVEAPAAVKATERCVGEEGSFKRKVMFDMIRAGHRLYGTHVGGDRALDHYMDIIEEGSRAADLTLEDIRAKRHGVDHARGVRPDQMERMVRLNMFQAYTGGVASRSSWMAEKYGEEYVGLVYPINSFIKAGGTPVWEGGGGRTLGLPYTNPEFTRLQDFIQRKGKDGKVWSPQERLDRILAMKIATSWPAIYMMRGDMFGTLEVGKKGDFLVLNKDYFEIPEDEIHTVKPLMTVVDGQTRFLMASWARELGLQPAGYQQE